MKPDECIKHYHSLPTVSSQLSKIITRYADKFNQYLQDCRLFNNLTSPVCLVTLMLDNKNDRFHFIASLHEHNISRYTMPFLLDKSFFQKSLRTVSQCMPSNTEVKNHYNLLQRTEASLDKKIANFLDLMFHFPIPLMFIDGFLYNLWNRVDTNSNIFFEVCLSPESDASGLPRFAVKSSKSNYWIKGNNDSKWHDQAKREDIQPVTFYKDWIGAVTGVKEIIYNNSKYGLWIPLVNDNMNQKLLGFIHSRAENQDDLQEYETFWQNNLQGILEDVKNVEI